MSDIPMGSGPPWIRPAIQKEIEWRDGDIVVAVPPKSGTTWTMNIVFQLLNGGTSDFRDIYEEVPWAEFVARPDQTMAETLARFDAMPKDKRRAFKTHSAPPDIPYVAPGAGADVSYVVIARNPEEALVSFWPFLANHSDDFGSVWGMPPGAMAMPDFETFYREFIVARDFHEHNFLDFINAWWARRDQPNVLFLHYADMKRDHEGSIRRIAKFLGVDPSPDEWTRILEYTSFPWMKAHEEKFEAMTASEVPILKRGAMIRRGKAGDAKSDGMTDDIARDLRSVGERVCPHKAALDWLYEGGDLR
jgi:hypothetical protein